MTSITEFELQLIAIYVQLKRLDCKQPYAQLSRHLQIQRFLFAENRKVL
jgi:hypothetical protein